MELGQRVQSINYIFLYNDSCLTCKENVLIAYKVQLLCMVGIGKSVWLKQKRMYESNLSNRPIFLSNEVMMYIFYFFYQTIYCFTAISLHYWKETDAESVMSSHAMKYSILSSSLYTAAGGGAGDKKWWQVEVVGLNESEKMKEQREKEDGREREKNKIKILKIIILQFSN